MRLITKITCNASLNAKAAALAPFLRMYDGCLIQTEEQWFDFVASVKRLLEDLNAGYPRTKPFEVYGFTDRGVYIVPEGKPDTYVASVWTEPVKALLTEDGIIPVEITPVEITPVENPVIECVDRNDSR